MSNSFLELALAASIGSGVFYLIVELYYEVTERIRARQHQAFLDEWEEEHWDD